jgi:DNA polymerase III delta subunit
VVEEELRPFNVERIYGDSDDAEAVAARILNAARTLPLLTDRRIVIAMQIDRLVRPPARAADEETAAPPPVRARRGGRKTAVSAVDQLEQFIADRPDHATLVLAADAVDERVGFVKRLLSTAVVVDCSGLGGARSPEEWVRAAAQGEKIQIDRATAQRLVDRTGGDPVRLRAAFTQLALYVAGRGRAVVDDVDAITTGGATSDDDWALVRAIEAGLAADALRELAARLDAGEPPLKILGQIGWAVRTKLAPRRSPPGVRAMVESVLQTDVNMKSSVDPRQSLERLVVELCGRA